MPSGSITRSPARRTGSNTTRAFLSKTAAAPPAQNPIAHLYKSQVYQLAEPLGVPAAIREREPTTDTWPLQQSQDEFYFSLPYPVLDLCLFALNHGIPVEAVADATGLTSAQVDRVWGDIAAKRKATRYLHEPPLLIEPVG